MTKRYFKITKLLSGNPLHDDHGHIEPVEAMKAHIRAKRDFQESAAEFAKSLGGVAVNVTGMTRLSLHGVYFDGEPEHPELWTKPDPKARFSRRPRAKGARSVKGEELKQAHKELLDRWINEAPEPCELDGQWLCGGYIASDLMFSGASMVVDLQNGELYVAASQPPERGAEFVEITGGEYQQAEKAARDQRALDYL